MQTDNRRLSSITLCTVLLTSTFSIFGAFTFFPLQEGEAQGLQLRVSAAQRPEFNNHFFGPMIVQIIIDDPGADEIDEMTAGLTLRGTSSGRVHLTDGLWYAYFAETDFFGVFADIVSDGSLNGGITVQDGTPAATPVTIGVNSFAVTTNADSFIRQITQIVGSATTTFIEVDQTNFFPTLPVPFFETATLLNPDLGIINNPAPGDGLCTSGEFNLPDTDCDWPYIELENMDETDSAAIRVGLASVNLIFDDFFTSIRNTLDRPGGGYPPNAEIISSFTDFQWNINPVEEDVVLFALNRNTGFPSSILYQPIRGFNPAGGLTPQNFPDLQPGLAIMDYDSRQVMEIDAPEGINAVSFIHFLDVSSATPAGGGAPAGFPVELAEEPFARTAENAATLVGSVGLAAFSNVGGPAPGTIAANDLPILRYLESDPNTSLFETVDETVGGRSNLFAAGNDRVANFDYFDIITSAPMTFNDGFLSFDKEFYTIGGTPVVTVTDQDGNLRSRAIDTLSVKVSSDSDQVGITLVLEEQAIQSALFTGLFMLTSNHSSQPDKALKARPGDILKASYEDVDLVGFKRTVTDFAKIVGATPPLAKNKLAFTFEDKPVVITLTGEDVDGDALIFSILTPPIHGTLSAITQISDTTALVTYTPDPSFTGIDRFRFRVSDGVAVSNIGRVTILVGSSGGGSG